MSKIMIWVGQFDSEADVEKYMDQSAFRQWWKDYDEDNKELRCQFCKELGVMNYDEDFLIPFVVLETIGYIAHNTICLLYTSLRLQQSIYRDVLFIIRFMGCIALLH